MDPEFETVLSWYFLTSYDITVYSCVNNLISRVFLSRGKSNKKMNISHY